MMDNFGWVNSITVSPPSASVWSNNQYVDKSDLDGAFFNPSTDQLRGDRRSIGVDRVDNMAEMLAPAFDSISNDILDLDRFLQQHQEAAARLAADHSAVLPYATKPSVALDQVACSLLADNFIAATTSQEFQMPGAVVNGVHCLSSSGNNLSSSGDSQGSSQADSCEGQRDCKRKLSTASTGGGFQIFFERSPTSKKGRSEKDSGAGAPNIDFRRESSKGYEPDTEAIAQVKEMIYRAAAMRPVNLATGETTWKPKRKNVRISSDPQTVAARQRRERISERLRVLQTLVPGGSKMDTASMLDEAANYLKFLKSQVSALETLGAASNSTIPPLIPATSVPFNGINNQQAFPMQSAALSSLHPKP